MTVSYALVLKLTCTVPSEADNKVRDYKSVDFSSNLETKKHSYQYIVFNFCRYYSVHLIWSVTNKLIKLRIDLFYFIHTECIDIWYWFLDLLLNWFLCLVLIVLIILIIVLIFIDIVLYWLIVLIISIISNIKLICLYLGVLC